MGRRFVAGLFVVTGALLILVLAGLWMLRSPAPGSSAVLPSGVRIKVEGVTFGTRHLFSTDSKLKRALRSVLPARLKDWWPAGYTSEGRTDETNALVYLSAFDPIKRAYVSPNWDHFQVLDKHGCAWPVQSWAGSQSDPGFSVSTICLPAFPRRDPGFKLRAVILGGDAVEMVVPNPVKSPFPKWTPEPLPASRTIDNATFELRDLQGHWPADRLNSFDPTYRVLQDGVDVTPQWRAVTEFRDATGNVSERLCPYEPVWKVEAKFFRTAQATFAAEKVWRIPGIRMPENGHAVMFNQTHQVANRSVHLIGLLAAGSFKFSNNVILAMSPWQSGMSPASSSSTRSVNSGPPITTLEFVSRDPAVLLSITSLRSPDQLLVRYRDQSGRGGQGEFRSGVADQYLFSLPNLRNVTSLDLELILQEPIPVEFSVAPPRPTERVAVPADK